MFTINGVDWDIKFVNGNSSYLTRSDGTTTIGMTDWNNRCVYLANGLRGALLRRVLAHELCHAFCFSYAVYMPIDEEEQLADWISLYGTELVYLLDNILNTALKKPTLCRLKF